MSDHGRTTPTREAKAVSSQDGWRRKLDGLQGLGDELIKWLESSKPQWVMQDSDLRQVKPADVVRRLLHLVQSANGNARADERAAWDAYAAEYMAALVQTETDPHDRPELAALKADCMLEERRKRFPGTGGANA